MIDADLRRLRQRRRRTARAPLYELLHAAFAHAMAPLAGRRVTESSHDEAVRAMRAVLGDLAGRGVFRFFGIADAFELGSLDVQFLLIGSSGAFLLDADHLIAQIFAGGRAGDGWLRPDALTLDDLAR